MPRRRSDRLDHDGDGACLAVEVGDRERDPLPLFVDHQDDELSRLARRGNRWRLDDLHEHVIGIVDFGQYLVHVLFLAVALVKPLRHQPRRPMPFFTEAKVLPWRALATPREDVTSRLAYHTPTGICGTQHSPTGHDSDSARFRFRTIQIPAGGSESMAPSASPG